MFADIPCPHDVKPLKTRYVLTKKKRQDGSLERYKARLVVKGYNQKYGVDYFETFFPVIKFDSFRTILALIATRKWDTVMLDFTQAYINAPIKENVWVQLPDKSIKKIQKALYGLKQAGLQWGRTFVSHILSHEYWTQSKYDECVFFATNKTDKKIAILWIYVDDCGITGSWKEGVNHMRNHLLQQFPGRDMGELKSYVGMHFDVRNDGILLHQKHFAEQIVNDFLGYMVRNTRSPLQKGADLTSRTATEQPLDIQKHPY